MQGCTPLLIFLKRGFGIFSKILLSFLVFLAVEMYVNLMSLPIRNDSIDNVVVHAMKIKQMRRRYGIEYVCVCVRERTKEKGREQGKC